MEASALHAPSRLSRLPLGTPLLRLRSDDQLVALFRTGSDEAFGVLHDRYRQRLFAYVRQMLSSHSRQDAEDVLQDVFARASAALRADTREVNVRAWMYRVAHNRCIDHLRRPVPLAADVFEVSRKPLHDPVDEAQRREDLKRLVADVGRLPDQQRSALLMREIDGISYADLATALDVTVPAVKSLLVRARVGLVEAQQARDADCSEIRRDLHASYDRGVKASGRARRHLRECAGCREYRVALRGMRRSFAALAPGVGAGPVALVAKLLGVGGAGAGGGAAAAGGAGSGLAVVGGATAACKVAAVVCATAITAGGAVEMQRLAHQDRANERPRPARKAEHRSAPTIPAAAPTTPVAAPTLAAPAARPRPAAADPAPGARARRAERRSAPERLAAPQRRVAAPPAVPANRLAQPPAIVPEPVEEDPPPVVAESGGTVAPEPASEVADPAVPADAQPRAPVDEPDAVNELATDAAAVPTAAAPEETAMADDEVAAAASAAPDGGVAPER
jgi:RNA polymerase sigma factor (sigma-70 family)